MPEDAEERLEQRDMDTDMHAEMGRKRVWSLEGAAGDQWPW